MVRHPPANAGDARDAGLILGSKRSPGGGNGNPLQYSCLENPMDRGAWGGYSPWGYKRIGHNLVTKQQEQLPLISFLTLSHVTYEPHFSCLNFNASIMESL